MDYLLMAKKRISACQETVQWKSVSDCEWCHLEAVKMCRAGKWGPLWYYITPARLYHFGRFIKRHHNPHPPPPYIVHLWKEFQLAPLREHMLHVNWGQMWGAEMLLESLRLWGCWCLQLAKLRPGTPESSCFTWTALPAFFFFPHRSVWCLVSSQGLTCSPCDVMGHTEHWTADRVCN